MDAFNDDAAFEITMFEKKNSDGFELHVENEKIRVETNVFNFLKNIVSAQFCRLTISKKFLFSLFVFRDSC